MNKNDKGAVESSGRDALQRLVEVAMEDTGQSRRVADFLLAWWNADECGGFDLTDMWGVDVEIASDMLKVMRLVAVSHSYPDSLGYGDDFKALVRTWRSELVEH